MRGTRGSARFKIDERRARQCGTIRELDETQTGNRMGKKEREEREKSVSVCVFGLNTGS